MLFCDFIHSLRELHTFCQQSLSLNNVIYVFNNAIQVAPLGQEMFTVALRHFVVGRLQLGFSEVSSKPLALVKSSIISLQSFRP